MPRSPIVPQVSIILPTFNRLSLLRQSIESVRAQTYPDWEIVIADDGSGDDTRAYLKRLAEANIRCIFLAHSGNPARVRNVAIAAARAPYLAFLDSDDVWAPQKLQRQMQALRERPGARWSYTLCDRIDAWGKPLQNVRLSAQRAREGWIFDPLLRLDLAIAMPTVLAERTLIESIGGFDELQLFGEFHDLCLRLALAAEVTAPADTLCSIRAHTEHYSGNRLAAHASWLRLYSKMTGLAPTRSLRAHCRKMQMQTALKLLRSMVSTRSLPTWKRRPA